MLGKAHTVLEYLKDVKRHVIGHSPFDIEDYIDGLRCLIRLAQRDRYDGPRAR